MQIRSPHSACFARWLWRRSWRRCDGGEPDHPEGFEALSSSDQCGRVDVKTCIHVLCWNLLLICSFMMSSGLLTYYSRYIGNQWFQTLNQCVREVIGQWPPPGPGERQRERQKGRSQGEGLHAEIGSAWVVDGDRDDHVFPWTDRGKKGERSNCMVDPVATPPTGPREPCAGSRRKGNPRRGGGGGEGAPAWPLPHRREGGFSRLHEGRRDFRRSSSPPRT